MQALHSVGSGQKGPGKNCHSLDPHLSPARRASGVRGCRAAQDKTSPDPNTERRVGSEFRIGASRASGKQVVPKQYIRLPATNGGNVSLRHIRRNHRGVHEFR